MISSRSTCIQLLLSHMEPVLTIYSTNYQCFKSVFIQPRSGYSQKSQSRSGFWRPLSLDLDPSYFLSLSENNGKYFIITRFFYEKKSTNVVKSKIILWGFNSLDLLFYFIFTAYQGLPMIWLHYCSSTLLQCDLPLLRPHCGEALGRDSNPKRAI